MVTGHAREMPWKNSVWFPERHGRWGHQNKGNSSKGVFQSQHHCPPGNTMSQDLCTLELKMGWTNVGIITVCILHDATSNHGNIHSFCPCGLHHSLLRVSKRSLSPPPPLSTKPSTSSASSLTGYMNLGKTSTFHNHHFIVDNMGLIRIASIVVNGLQCDFVAASFQRRNLIWAGQIK